MENTNNKQLKKNESGTHTKPEEGSYANNIDNRATSTSMPVRGTIFVSTMSSLFPPSKESQERSSEAGPKPSKSNSLDRGEIANGASCSKQGSARAEPTKNVRPSKQIWYEKQQAYKELQRKVKLGQMKPWEVAAAATEQAKKKVLENAQATKKKFSDQEFQPTAKLPRKSSDMSVSNTESDSGRVIAVIDRMREDGSIPQDKWHWVEAALASVFLQVLDEYPGICPTCDDAGWHDDRIKLISCNNERSAMLFKVAMKKIGEVWPGAKLEAVEKSEIPSRLRAWVCLPITPSEPENILKMFRVCNPGIPMNGWTISKIQAPEGPTRQVLLRLNEESLVPLEQCGWTVYYAFNTVLLKICSWDTEASCFSAEADQPHALIKQEKEEPHQSNVPNQSGRTYRS